VAPLPIGFQIHHVRQVGLLFAPWQYWGIGLGCTLGLGIAISLFFQHTWKRIGVLLFVEFLVFVVVGELFVGPLINAIGRL
jgi:integral membrane sensor domain MASE1